MSYYPIFLNIGGKKCVVVGGGEVALRKVTALLESKAGVTVVSPDLCAGLEKLAENKEIAVIRRLYRAGDLKGARIVISATDDFAINQRVAGEARKAGIPVNVVDDLSLSDFIVPSRIARGDVSIAVSTAGKSPALARKIRVKLEKDFGGEYALLADLVGEVRAELKQLGIKVDADAWQAALDIDLMLDLIKKGKSPKARALLRERLKVEPNEA